ncbi:DMT family transporter [Acuticoccus sp. MNP-M23]|uniref:DMT family transporter n=1 Tax=Acuticoccus sp. MNP-M23 TaxID=3072793 RepID=UPI002814E336|nr:DMT family transporter [Acuticoccus sp. MNP-M23]WMS43291.1 DMT family transporter [Acuticoccus sp. MNP-M23]
MTHKPAAAAASAVPAAVAPAFTARMDGPAWVMLVALSALWGCSFVFVEVILTAIPVLSLVALRVLFAALTLWIAVGLIGAAIPRAPRIWGAFAVLGFVNNAVPFSLIVYGQTEITAGLAAILNATTPLFTGLIAGIALTDERLTPAKLGGMALGLTGVVVMIGPGAILALGEEILPELAILGAALSYALAAVYGRRFKRFGVRPVVIAAGQTSASATIMVPLALFMDGPAVFQVDSPLIWAAVVANACLSTALAYILYFTILGRAGATNASLVTVLVPVFAVIAGTLLLNESLAIEQICGMGLIFAGLAVIDGRLFKRSTERP